MTAACSGKKPLPGRRVLLLRPENMQCRGGKYPKKLLAGVPGFDSGRGDMFPFPTILSRSVLRCGVAVVLLEYIIKENVTRQRTNLLQQL